MVVRKCQDCGRRGDEDPDDPAPRLCPDCYQARMHRITPRLENMMTSFGPDVAMLWLEEALVDIGGETPAFAKCHVDALRRGELIDRAGFHK